MARIQTRTNERHENIAKAANQAAEAALCHYAHFNGVHFTDEDFDAQQATMRNAIMEQLHRIEHAKVLATHAALNEALQRAVAVEELSDELAAVAPREPRMIPAVTTRW